MHGIILFCGGQIYWVVANLLARGGIIPWVIHSLTKKYTPKYCLSFPHRYINFGGFAIAKALTHKKKKSCNEMSNLIRLRKVNQ